MILFSTTTVPSCIPAKCNVYSANFVAVLLNLVYNILSGHVFQYVHTKVGVLCVYKVSV
jgi:hypothetical protein